MENQCIKISDLRKVKGIGEKTIDRIKETLLQDGDYISRYNPKLHLKKNNIYQGDCLELMNGIPDESVDMILCDLPYGTTACSWDEVIPFEPLWHHYKRVIKDNGAIILFGSEPFSTKLRMSNLEWYRYDWIWKKNKPTGFANANRRPIKNTERISVFFKRQSTYNPQGLKRYDKPKIKKRRNPKSETVNMGENDGSLLGEYCVEYYNYPREILEFQGASKTSHPTQKPVELFEYLIKTYTNEGALILDNCIGSGTTAVAAINTNRSFIGMELNNEYYILAKGRINKHIKDHDLQVRGSVHV